MPRKFRDSTGSDFEETTRGSLGFAPQSTDNSIIRIEDGETIKGIYRVGSLLDQIEHVLVDHFIDGVRCPAERFGTHRIPRTRDNRVGPRNPATWADERLVDEIVDSVVGLQECLDPLPQLGIAHAFVVQYCGAVRDVMKVGSLQENGLHALRVQRHRMLLRLGTASRFHRSMRHLRPGLSKEIEKPSLQRKNKADVMEYPEVLDHIGLLVDEPPGLAGLPST
jgi:hypothetical protein